LAIVTKKPQSIYVQVKRGNAKKGEGGSKNFSTYGNFDRVVAVVEKALKSLTKERR
jgi:hypothetical protein